MSADGDHHYIPQFHLQKWENATKEVTVWRRIDHTGKLFVERKTTAAVAYVPGLYAMQQVPSERSQVIENSVFANAVETNAAPILGKLIAGRLGSLSEEEKGWWAVYLNSSLLRLPHSVKRFRNSAKEHAAASFADGQQEYEAIRGNSPESTLYEWIESHYPNVLANIHLEIMVKMLAKPEIIDRMMSLTWIVFDLSRASRTLLLGDHPLLSVSALFSPAAFIALPLSPTRLFVATDDESAIRRVTEMPPRELVSLANMVTLRNVRQFIFGDAERSFLDKHFPRTLP